MQTALPVVIIVILSVFSHSKLLYLSQGESENNLGTIYLESKNYDMAITCFQEALRKSPDKFKVHANLAYAFELKGELQKAVKESETVLKAAIAAGRDDDETAQLEILQLAEGLLRQLNKTGDKERAKTAREDILQRYRKAIEVHIRKKDSLSSASDKKPDFRLQNIYLQFGMRWKEQGDFKEAAATLEKAFSIDGKNAAILNELTVAYVLSGNLKKVRELLARHSSERAHVLKFIHQTGERYLINKDYEKAKRFLEIIFLSGEKDAVLYNSLAVCYQKTGLTGKALELLEKAAAFNKGHQNTYINMGLIYHESGKYEKAIESYGAAIRIAPQTADIYIKKGLSHVALNQFDKALEAFRKAQELDKNDPVIYTFLGNAYYTQKNYAAALEAWEKSLGLNPADQELAKNVSALKESMKKK
jgi:tetratricopeptide (TPR) repeat protein